MSRLKYIRSQIILFSVLAISFSSDSMSQPECDTEAVAKAREGLAYLLGIDVEVDTKRGEALLVESAELGCATTQVGLGEAYLFGNLGLEPDDEQAWYWFRQSGLGTG
jgi:hypothetical protein